MTAPGGVARYCHDWEFDDRGFAGIMPISVGIVGEDGREYYAVNADLSMDRILRSDFLRAEVLPHLPMVPMPEGARGEQYILDRSHPSVKPLAHICREIPAFLLAPGLPVELWAYYNAHDHYLMASLNGRMIDSTPGVPWFTRDIKGESVDLGPDFRFTEQPECVHHALHDARHDWVRLRELWTAKELRQRAAEGYVEGICPECADDSAIHWQNDGESDTRVVCGLCQWEGWEENLLRGDVQLCTCSHPRATHEDELQACQVEGCDCGEWWKAA